jgi:two-component system phosphate regulon sensor histidine kinase PhoR
MGLMSTTTSGVTDPQGEVRRLRRELARERVRRRMAESMGERATADLYDSVRELRSAQGELLEPAHQTMVVTELARKLRDDLDSGRMVNRVAESVGRATAVDRCDVLLVDADLYAAVHGTWSGSQESARLPHPESFVELPESLTSLLLDTAQQLTPLQIERVDQDPRIDPGDAAEIITVLGVHALAAVPVAVGDEVVGWLLLQSVRPRAWQPGELALCERLSHDLVSSLIQVQAFEQQRESVRRLEELDRAKDAFISNVSHELRTPLTSIAGYLELMSEGGMGASDNGVSEGVVAIIERNVGRLRDLVEDLLTLSAYDAAQVSLDLSPNDLSALVAECHQALVPAFDARQLEVAVVTEPGLPAVLCDRTQIERVVLNLLSNAVKFSHDGQRVRVELRAAGSDVELSISDTGIGIPAGEQERLFSRFFRSSLAMADEIQGTGLGLTLVQTIVEWHEGTVRVDSVEGEGTTVIVRLPQAP